MSADDQLGDEMLELIKVILDTIVKAFSPEAFREAKKQKRLTEIGVDLFLLYSHLNSVIIVGRAIVEQLEKCLLWMSSDAEAEPDWEYRTDLPFLLKQQRVNLEQFVESLIRLQRPVELISRDSINQVVGLLSGKFAAIGRLLQSSFDRSGEPRLFAISEETFAAVIHEQVWRLSEPEHAFNEMLAEHPIDDLGRIPARRLPVIKAYLELRNPRAVIAGLETVAESIRSGIRENFSLQDILLSVGDKRGAPRCD